MFGMKLPQWRTALLGLLGASSLVACGQNTPSPVPSPASGAEVAVEDDLSSQATIANGLTGVYYNNADFTGTTVTRVDTTINKSWGTGRPVTGIDPTTYSVRWMGQITPGYSETYTFFLSSSGAARLLVNGQPVVNDWTDHGLKTSSGTITLNAGVKYDIQLEMRRATSTPGAVKLEWQSSKQSRQIVPQTRLFSSGSNAQAALNVLQADPNVRALGLTFDLLKTRATLSPSGGLSVLSLLPNETGFVLASVRANQSETVLHFSRGGAGVRVSSLTDGRTLDLGAVEQYGNPDGTHTKEQALRLAQKVGAFLSNGFYSEASIQWSEAGQLTGQAFIISNGCKLTLKPPPECAGGVCAGEAAAYRDAVCSELGVIEDVFAFAFFPPTAAMGDVGLTVAGMLPTEFHHWAWGKYRNCLETHNQPVPSGSTGKPEGCVVGIRVTATEPQRRVRVNTSGQVEVSVANISADPVWPANATLDATVQFTSVSANVSTVMNRVNFKILPGGSNGFSVGYVCPSTPTTLHAEISFLHNANRPISDRASVKIDCIDVEPKLQAPGQLTISAPVGQTASGSFEISNVGDPGSVLNYTLTPSGGLSVSPTNGSLEQSRTSSLTVSAPCTTAGTSNALLLVESNDPGKPQHTIPVSVKCLGENWIGHISFTFNAGYSREGDNYEEGLCEANAYTWYRNDGNLYAQLGMQHLTFRGMEKITWSGYWWSVDCDSYGHQALSSKDELYTATLNELVTSWKQNNDPSIDDSKVTFRSMPYIIQEPSFPGNGTSSGSLGWNIYALY